jgi:glycosyltransferase involved in cell wall biosynthesis
MNKKISIMHLRDSAGIFGAERVILTIGKNIDHDRFAMKLLCMKRADGISNSLIRKAKETGIDTITVNVKGRLDLGAIKEIRQIVLENKVDIVHSHDFKSDFYSLIACRGSTVKKITTAHGSTRDSWLKKIYLYLDEGLLYPAFDRIIAVSEDLRPFLERKGIQRNKIRTIQNGLDFQLLESETGGEVPLNIPYGKIIFAVIGRLYPDKGHDFFLRSLADVLKNYANAYGIIVGDGPSRDHIAQQIQQLNLEESVKLCGIRSDMHSIYKRIDCLVISSLTEGLPYVLLEAMANKVPVISTAVGDVPILIKPGQTGTLVPPRNVVALERAMSGFMKDAKPFIVMAENARKMVFDQFSAERMIRQLESLYLELLNFDRF